MRDDQPDLPAADPAVGQRLREARRRAGLSQTALAGTDLSASYVSLLESGRRNATDAVLARLAQRLGVTLQYLRDGHDPNQVERARLALDYADLALRNGEPADALAHLEATDDGREAWRAEEEWRRRRLHVRALEGVGRLEEALGEIEVLRREAREQRRYDEFLQLTVDAVRCSCEAGDVSYAVDIGEAALESVQSWGLSGSEVHAELASSVLGAYYERGDLLRAQRMAAELLAELEAAGTTKARAAVLWNASLLAEQRDDLPAALGLAQRALAAYAETDDARATARLRVAYGWLLLRVLPPRPGEARRELLAAQEALADFGSEIDLAYVETELARCSLLLDEPREALDLAESARQRLGDQPRLESAHTELVRARALLAVDGREAAVAAYRGAATTLSGLELSRQAAAAWRELADAFTELGQFADATLAYQQALTDAGVRAAPDVTYAARSFVDPSGGAPDG